MSGDTTETLTLPEPARTLWKRIADTIQTELRAAGEPRLGGGTLLAARWKHRTSVDIDLTIEKETARIDRIDRLTRGNENLHHALSRLHAERVFAVNKDHVTVTFDISELDITVLKSQPRHGERRAVVEGQEWTVLSSTQVLGGKLSRADELLHRDAYDIRHAALVAPADLAKAVNRLSARETEQIIHRWQRIGPEWRTRAEETLRPVLRQYSARDITRLASETADAIQNARYRMVKITTHGREGVFDAETVAGLRVTVPFEHKRLEATLSEHGITGYLNNQAEWKGTTHPMEAVRRACGFWKRAQTVYEGEHKTEMAKWPAPGTMPPVPPPPAAGAAERQRKSRGPNDGWSR